MNIDWKHKLTFRKFWVAVTALISGLILAFGGSETAAGEVSGIVMSAASAVAYIIGEGLTDAANTSAAGNLRGQ